MAGWHVIENYLEETCAHSALLGKYWITMFLVLRMLVLFSIAEGAFGEDDEKLGLRRERFKLICSQVSARVNLKLPLGIVNLNVP